MDFVTAFNAAASLVLSAVCGWAILHPSVRDGIVIKVGLILVSLGMAGTALLLLEGLDPSDVWRLNHTRAVILAGMLITAGGLLWRVYRGQRRSSDFVERRRST